MLDEINKFLCINNIADLCDKEQDHAMVNDLIKNHIDNMRKLEKENPNFLFEINIEQKLHLAICNFKIRLMDQFNIILTELISIISK